ncbi:ABC transporter permease [Lysinibacter cavernae]|uniref:Peptide/nickel transport system permease protein n=1 Tax=Lysinibacter cavernae TaxID=1640652 RepID=A0A7X5R3U7_9MICO|nr:ABC transporter permease [Lysinibacter cavernae]NIH54872.1 peptide/nickel transport system permease protein [Lysinibacter cavernae]
MARINVWVFYLLPKLGQFLFVILATYTLTFVLIHFLPGDPLVAALASKSGDSAVLDPAVLDAQRVKYGLDGSLWEQYFGHLLALFRGDLGISISTGVSVTDMIARALPHSAQIASLALVIGVIGAVIITFLAFAAPWPWLRNLLMQIPPFGVAIPAFLSGILLITIFSFGLDWLPSSGVRSPGSQILPAITLALPVGAIFFQVFSSAVFDAMSSSYVFTAEAKGVPPRSIFIKHLLRNALLPSVTILGLLIGYLAGGTAVVETVFSRDGIGRMTVNAVLARDINVIQGVVLVVGATYAIVNLLVDIAYGVIDPRTRPAAAKPSRKAQEVGA